MVFMIIVMEVLVVGMEKTSSGGVDRNLHCKPTAWPVLTWWLVSNDIHCAIDSYSFLPVEKKAS